MKMKSYGNRKSAPIVMAMPMKRPSGKVHKKMMGAVVRPMKCGPHGCHDLTK
jgi:hypothetical protein